MSRIECDLEFRRAEDRRCPRLPGDRCGERQIREAAGDRIVAVVGAGHVHGMLEALQDEDLSFDLDQIDRVPAVSSWWKWVGWGVPVLIIGSIGYIVNSLILLVEKKVVHWKT